MELGIRADRRGREKKKIKKKEKKKRKKKKKKKKNKRELYTYVGKRMRKVEMVGSAKCRSGSGSGE
jgi:hypothetical protein